MTLKAARERVNLSQEELAKKMCISVSSIRNWEQNRSAMASMSWIDARGLMLYLDLNDKELEEMFMQQLDLVAPV